VERKKGGLMASELINKLVDIALAEVGTKEEGGNNRGKRIETYMQSTWLVPAPWAWCAAFTCYVLHQWLKLPEVRTALNMGTVDEKWVLNKWRCRDASAFGWIKWALQKNLYVCDEKEPAKKGDIVVFDFSHIGIVAEDQLPGKDYIETIEGNTNGRGDRDSVLGDGVWR
jgi:hypothetical protein